MYTIRNNIPYIFERDLKWKLNQKNKRANEQFKILLNVFGLYDLDRTGKINCKKWGQALIKSGLITMSQEELDYLFNYYVPNNAELIDYNSFAYNFIFQKEKSTQIKQLQLININNKTNNGNNVQNNNDFSNYYKIKTESSINAKTNNYPISYDESYNIYNILSKDVNYWGDKINDLNNYNLSEIRSNGNNRYSKLKSVGNERLKNNRAFMTIYLNNTKESFQNKINIDNGVTYYKLIYQLKNKSSNENIISRENLSFIFQEIGVFYTQRELQDFYIAIGCEENNDIPIPKILEVFEGSLNDFRKNLILDIFSAIDKNKEGKISLTFLKSMYKANLHPDVLNQKMTETEAYNQFSESLDIYCKINNLTDSIDIVKFLDYYSGISATLSDNRKFYTILNNVWLGDNINENENQNEGNNETKDYKAINKCTSSPQIIQKNMKKETIKNNYNLKSIEYIKNSNKRTDLMDKDLSNLGKSSTNNSRLFSPLFFYKKEDDLLQKSYDFQVNKYKPYSSRESSQNLANEDLTNYSNFRTINRDINKIERGNYPISTGTNNLNNFSNILIKLRRKLLERGPKSIFYFQRMLYVYDVNRKGEISLNNLMNIIQTYNLDFDYYEIKLIFDYFDKKKCGFIKYNDLLNSIIGEISQNKEILIKKLYNDFNKDIEGNVSLIDLKNSYQPSKHPGVVCLKKSVDEAYGDFLECLEIFKEYNNNLKGEYTTYLTIEEFIIFFKEISLSITNDFVFMKMLENCWKSNSGDIYSTYINGV